MVVFQFIKELINENHSENINENDNQRKSKNKNITADTSVCILARTNQSLKRIANLLMAENIDLDVYKRQEFMALRDNRPEFENDKAMGRAGVPAFLLEDGTITFNPYDVGLERLGGRP